MPWPTAIRAPTSLRLVPLIMVSAVTGPGIMTPVSEISITEARNSGRLEVFVIVVKTTLSIPYPPLLGELGGSWGTPPNHGMLYPVTLPG